MSTYANSNQNKFLAAAQKERAKLDSLYAAQGITQYQHTPDAGYHHYDSKFKLNGKYYIVEAKVRTGKMDDTIYSSGYFLEKMKYNNLIAQKSKMQQYQPSVLYINFFNDGHIVFDLTPRIAGDILMHESTISCNKYSVYDAGKVDKPVYILEVTPKDSKRYSTTRPPQFTSPTSTNQK